MSDGTHSRWQSQLQRDVTRLPKVEVGFEFSTADFQPTFPNKNTTVLKTLQIQLVSFKFKDGSLKAHSFRTINQLGCDNVPNCL